MPGVALRRVLRFPRGDRCPGISPEGRWRLKLPHQLERPVLAADLRWLKASLPLAPAVIEDRCATALPLAHRHDKHDCFVIPPIRSPSAHACTQVKAGSLRLSTATAISFPSATVAKGFLSWLNPSHGTAWLPGLPLVNSQLMKDQLLS